MCNDPSLRFLRPFDRLRAQNKEAGFREFLPFVSGRISEEGMRVG